MNLVYYIYIGLLLLLFPLTIEAKVTPADSLKTLLTRIPNSEKRVEIRINIDEYNYNHDANYQPNTAWQLLSEAIKAENEYGITKALRHLVLNVDRKERTLANDSIAHYMKLAEERLTGEWKDCFTTEIRIRSIRSSIDWSANEKRTILDMMRQYTDSVKFQSNVYTQIEREYALGKSCSFLHVGGYENLRQGVCHFEKLQALIEDLPIKARATLFFSVYQNLFATYSNAGEREKTIKMLESLIRTVNEYRELPFVKKDLYLDFSEFYYEYYTAIARCPDIVGAAEAYKALKHAEKLSLLPFNSTLTLFSTYQEYYYRLGDVSKAIQYADTFIKAVRDSDFLEAPVAISIAYKEKAQMYAEMHDFQNAYDHFLLYDELKDSLTNKDAKKLREEMNVRYGVNKLELDKLQLEARNRRIELISVFLVLVLAVAWGFTQRINIKKLKQVQKSLIESSKEVMRQSQKAQESEKMKSAFINSMCHEIRTPLNSINGFSNLLLDPSVENELKKDFPELIQQNTNQLARLINDLLEVALLDSSVERLPLELVNINALLTHEFKDLITQEKKPTIEYILDLPEQECVIFSNHTYFTHVIANILNNANKFTSEGKIILACRKNEERKLLIITLTDTGIGIPVDKHEWVFERFTKIDDFKPGTGMGLYVCKLIMPRLNGRITVDPRYAKGTRFIITLPL